MLRLLPSLAVAAIVGAALWWLVDVVQDRAELRGHLRDMTAQRNAAVAARQQAEDALSVHRVYLQQAAARAADLAAIKRDLDTMGGHDAPLSPLLRSAAGRLWRQ